jgi:predicted RNase H-like HicB family nuclease
MAGQARLLHAMVHVTATSEPAIYRGKVPKCMLGSKPGHDVSSRVDRAAVAYLAVWESAMLTIEVELEEDGRWIGEVPALAGVIAYGTSEAEARQKAAALALRVIADRMEHGEAVPEEARALFAPA